ncbi:isochorismatase [Rhodococcus rhodochrous]|uniref:cysteine hydrolase family protein n=1 Tax=Rhodococcus rhodochrous TaxID=1829 RepID=UPI000750DAAA|nr:cysteine hydrolase [Rhodococcus rhodochrous]MDO1485110.1 cysteine hydrolase [Rhodococcus rhodochrous]SNV10076.1 isochorismatase [Rhodococcus rhodochrous]
MSTLPGATERGALLVIDVQHSFADPAHLPWLEPDGAAALAAAVDRTTELVDAFRRGGLPVLWVRLEQRAESPWASSRHLRGIPDEAPWPGDEPCVADTAGVRWFGVEPGPGETVVTKRRYSAFLGTDLAAILTDAQVEWLCVAGLTTECCVLTTTFDGMQLGYRMVVASDAVATYDPRLHDASLRILADNAAWIRSTADLASAVQP